MNMKHIAVSVFLLGAIYDSSATALLDQDATVQAVPGTTIAASNSVVSGLDGWDLLQTFTAGKTGKLAAIGLQGYQWDGLPTVLDLSIYQGNGTNMGSIAAGHLSFTSIQTAESFNAGGVTIVDLSSLAFNVTAGATYSYAITSAHDVGDFASAGKLRFAIGTTLSDGTLVVNDYSGGRSYRRFWFDGTTPGWDLSGSFSLDRGFQTYVDVSAVPEASGWTMLMAGLGMMATLAQARARADKRS